MVVIGFLRERTIIFFFVLFVMQPMQPDRVLLYHIGDGLDVPRYEGEKRFTLSSGFTQSMCTMYTYVCK
jgi:hypothetical protein